MATKQELLDKCKTHAESKGIQLNPKGAFVETILDTLLKNEKELGYQLCPCRLPSGDMKIDGDFICPCVPHLNDIKNDGHCHCFLYLKK